jgi:hypothetical protein
MCGKPREKSLERNPLLQTLRRDVRHLRLIAQAREQLRAESGWSPAAFT